MDPDRDALEAFCTQETHYFCTECCVCTDREGHLGREEGGGSVLTDGSAGASASNRLPLFRTHPASNYSRGSKMTTQHGPRYVCPRTASVVRATARRVSRTIEPITARTAAVAKPQRYRGQSRD
ncbi:unnamed protein product, partial [Iphiclides podalirius]